MTRHIADGTMGGDLDQLSSVDRRNQLRDFTEWASNNLDESRLAMRKTSHWIFDPESGRFGPGKLLAFLDFESYREDKNLFGYAGQTTSFAKKVLGEGAFFNPDRELSVLLKEWAASAISKKIFDRINTGKWVFISLDEKGSLRSVQPAKKRMRERGGKPEPVGSVLEGEYIECTAYRQKRNQTIRHMKLEKSNGICECCGTDFTKILEGKGCHALQVHHRDQLANSDAPRLTRLDDLAVVCANCHSLIHMNPKKALRVEVLKKLLQRD